jgi:hypothetical protein
MGPLLGPGDYIVLPAFDQGGAAMVDHEKTGQQAVPRAMNPRVNWSEVFTARPELEPPGYKEAMKQANEAQEQRGRR